MAMNRSYTWAPQSYLTNDCFDYGNYIEMGRSTTTTGAEICSDGFPTQFLNTSQAHLASSAPCTEQSVWSKPGVSDLPMMQSPHCTDVSTEKNIDAKAYDVQDFVNRDSFLNSRAPPIGLLQFSSFAIPTSYSHYSPTFTTAPSMISDHSTSPSLSRTISMNSGFSSFTVPSSVPDMARVKSAPDFEFSTDPSQQRNSRFPSTEGSSRRVSSPSHLHDMQRSASNASNGSCSKGTSKKPAGRSRGKVSPSCTIAPKKDTATITFGSPNGSHMVRVESSDGTSKDFGVISKLSTPAPSRRRQGSTPSAGYARPVKPRCDKCNEVPQGFRGEHELTRHYNLRHKPVQTFWICVDPTPGAKFLSKCHHCESKKRYGQYYNAAAHLRRVHFQPRRRGRKAKNAKVEKRRPGFINDNTPPMEELKREWLQQVHIKNLNPEVDEVEEVEDVGSVIEGEDRFDGVVHMLSKKRAHPIIYDRDMETDEDDTEGQVDGMAYDIPEKYFSRESAKRYWEDDPMGLLHGVGSGPAMKIIDVDPLHMSNFPSELSWGPST